MIHTLHARVVERSPNGNETGREMTFERYQSGTDVANVVRVTVSDGSRAPETFTIADYDFQQLATLFHSVYQRPRY